jgi:hypothetical protein
MVDLIDAIVVDLSDQKLCAYNRQQQLVRMVLVVLSQQVVQLTRGCEAATG